MPEAEVMDVVGRLEELAARLEEMMKGGGVRMSPREALYRRALCEVVLVLEETKHAFRSRRLKELRERIEAVLEGEGA